MELDRRTKREPLIEQHDRANREAALIIVADAERYKGLMFRWARAVLERDGQQRLPLGFRCVA